MGFFNKLKEGLTKTRQGFVEKVSTVLTFNKTIDEDLFEELEETLIQADVGVNTSMKLVETMRRRVKERKLKDASQLREVMKEEIAHILVGDNDELGLNVDKDKKNVILVVGVNGAGKTTTIGKLAHRLKKENHRVLLAAGDTFRAAAIDQLLIWGQRVGVEVIHNQEGSDPGAVVFDACKSLASRRDNVLIIDTAGRLQNKTNLMEELRKVGKILARELPEANVEVLLVLDATTGQNAISQAQLFSEVVNVTGICLTKLDGTAKGGVIVGIRDELKIPVKLIGIGEGIDDLKDFQAEEFAEALFAEEEA
ncbi:signal recognition particle-docking protein FtsY [Dehalobacterium formicoaceticum]|uniref:Signal recognition particle receptor FtsY n=1 Tax=Dehalobacterium formicoaceticum TaxID=51515 RepID=A0ABT1Y006_9FIRM|nr:signal recognition particle-docking protein FtsY [Dehalobacterium formicoaceticum]MCR6544207.1 signal recognition particle-docking protein FtsY [Dehalobacterium formicoaceticum]